MMEAPPHDLLHLVDGHDVDAKLASEPAALTLSAVNGALLRAIAVGALDLVESLIGLFDYLNESDAQTDYYIANAMTASIDHKQLGILSLLIGCRPSIAVADSLDLIIPPLHFAVQENSFDAATLLIKSGYSVSQPNRTESTPLHVAATLSTADMAALLLANGASPSAATSSGVTPLHVAALHARARPMATLLDTILQGMPKKSTVRSVAGGRSSSVIDPRLSDGRTPFLCACESGALDIAEMLISLGANIRARCGRRRTALHYAAASHPVVATWLIEKGLDVRAVDADDVTPLHVLCGSLTASNVVDFTASGAPPPDPMLLCGHAMLTAGANPSATDVHGVQPIHLAAQRGHIGMAMLLAEAGATGLSAAPSSSPSALTASSVSALLRAAGSSTDSRGTMRSAVR